MRGRVCFHSRDQKLNLEVAGPYPSSVSGTSATYFGSGNVTSSGHRWRPGSAEQWGCHSARVADAPRVYFK